MNDPKEPVLPCWYCEGRTEDGPYDPKVTTGWLCEACDERREWNAQRDALREERDHAWKVLHDLTPGGSEFVNDPDRCADHIRRMRTGEHAAHVKAIEERDRLRTALEVMGGPCLHDSKDFAVAHRALDSSEDAGQ